ncbi:MAG: class A beta-lactamase-related serine hydrolase [Chloroflexi bacterium]|nr:class A beta-lactamase-related serine hydrolase [Chloroflexota bacterium]
MSPLGTVVLAAAAIVIAVFIAVRGIASHFQVASVTMTPTPAIIQQISPDTDAIPEAPSTAGAAATPSSTAGAETAATGVLAPLAVKLQEYLSGLHGTYGVWVADIPTGATLGIRSHQQFIAASVIKTYILVALYEEVAEGKLKLSDTMTTTAADIQDYGTGSIRYDPIGTTFTLADLAERAAKQSDNTAAFMLRKRLGDAYIQQRVTAWGMTETNVAGDRTSPADIGHLFLKLAERKLLPPKEDLEVLGLLVATDFEDRLPALLPDYALTAHKIGTETDGVINDAGLIVLPTRSYVVAVLSSGTDPAQAIAAEQQLSRTVFAFESTLP